MVMHMTMRGRGMVQIDITRKLGDLPPVVNRVPP
jgi:hypothetical protein